MKMKNVLVAAAATAAALSASAFAGDVQVEFSSSLLKSEHGRAQVAEMIEKAAQDFCREEAFKTRRLTGIAACQEDIMESLVDEANERFSQYTTFTLGEFALLEDQ